MSNYIPIKSADISKLTDGSEVIVECRHWDANTGRPMPSDFYRAKIGHHMTVSGPAADMTPDPNWEYPMIPPWQGTIYAENTNTKQLWKRSDVK